MDVLFEFLALQHGLLVAAVVVDIALVALDPVVVQLVLADKTEQHLPEVGVQRVRRQPQAQPFSSASSTYLESEYSSTMQGSRSASSA